MRYGQIVMGPAGSGKSTYCSNIVKHCTVTKRVVRVVNLDPAAENFDYPVEADIRNLISVDDVMDDEDLKLGPNGGLVFCMECSMSQHVDEIYFLMKIKKPNFIYFVKNFEWLEEQLGEGEDDYFLFDCPGQIELYTHIPVMQQLVAQLQLWNFRLCGVFLLDSQFLTDAAKFFSGIMTALSTMVTLELPHVNVMGKLDLLDKKMKKEIERYLDPDTSLLLSELKSTTNKKFHKLNKAMCSLIDDYSLVSFQPLDISEEESMEVLLMYIDHAIQYGEDLDVKVPGLESGFDDEDTAATGMEDEMDDS